MADPTPVKTDREIVELALRERAFFGEIVLRYQEKLARYITRLGVKNADDRDDVLQEIFIKVYKNLNEFDQTLTFSSWIYRIAHNEAISWYRKRQSRPEGYLVSEGDTIVGLLKDDGEDAESRVERSIDAAAVARALERLDERYRNILILRYFEHLEYDEISDVLKIPLGTVGTWVARAKKRFKVELANENPIKEKYE